MQEPSQQHNSSLGSQATNSGAIFHEPPQLVENQIRKSQTEQDITQSKDKLIIDLKGQN